MAHLILKKKSFTKSITTERLAAGLDIHKHYVTASLVKNNDQNFRKIKTQEFQSNPEGLLALCRFLRKYSLQYIVMESTGVYTPPVYNFLRKYNGWPEPEPDMRVINPSLIRKYPGEVHQDTLDSELLAKLGLLGLAKQSFLPSGRIEELRRLSREIQISQQESTRIKARIKRVLSQWGLTLSNINFNNGWALDLCHAIVVKEGSIASALLAILNKEIKTSSYTIRTINSRLDDFIPYSEIILPRSINVLFKGYLANLAMSQSLISLCIKQIEEILKDEPKFSYDIWRLAQISGIDERTATLICAEIGDINRFPTMKQFLSYAGAAATVYQSGTTTRKGHLSKRVNNWLKTTFYHTGKIICTVVRKDSDLRNYGKIQMSQHRDKKRLGYANTGIKVARIVYMILKHDRLYNPFHEEKSIDFEEMPMKDVKYTIKIKELRRRTNIYIRFMQKLCDEFEGQKDQIHANFMEIWKESAAWDTMKV